MPKAAKTKQSRIGRQWSGNELKQFRHDVAQLKAKGLIPGKSIDARKARPFQVRGGSHLYEIVRQYNKVLSGEAQAVKLPRASVIEQHRLGHKTLHGKVLIPKSKTEKVKVVGGEVHIVDTRTGMSRVDVPRKPGESLEDWAARTEAASRDATKGRGRGKKVYIGYEFYGHKSYKFYSGKNSVSDMIADIKNKYILRINTGDLKAMNFFDHMSILTFDERRLWK